MAHLQIIVSDDKPVEKVKGRKHISKTAKAAE